MLSARPSWLPALAWPGVPLATTYMSAADLPSRGHSSVLQLATNQTKPIPVSSGRRAARVDRAEGGERSQQQQHKAIGTDDGNDMCGETVVVESDER